MEGALFLIKKFIPRPLFSWIQPFYHFSLAGWAALFYGFPSRRLIVIGVTGTKGKTTVIELLREILEENGSRVASFSSIGLSVAGEKMENDKKMTMPGRMQVQKFLYRAAEKKCKYAILEVTSEGIKQFRHRFINFDIAIMTNLTPEHLEAHGGLEKYLRAKLDLFWRLTKDGIAVINRDDPNMERFLAATGAHKAFYGKDDIQINDRRFALCDLQIDDRGISFDLGGVRFSSPLLGEFNLYNILAAVAVGLSQHYEPDRIARAVGRMAGIPGRMEFIQREPFAVVVDYAHTPDSLREVYRTLREFKKFSAEGGSASGGKSLICVLGSAGGGRDKWKRPAMGKIATEFCNQIIITNEDPYDENPQEIMRQIHAGILSVTSNKLPATKLIPDRRSAIREALRAAKSGDAVILTGKGAEKWIMGPQGTRIPWDEKKVAEEELRNVI